MLGLPHMGRSVLALRLLAGVASCSAGDRVRSWRKVVLSTTDPIARLRRLLQTGRHLFNHPSPLAKALGAERQGTGIVPRGERRPNDGRQGTAFSDAEGRDVVAARVCHIDEPAHRHGNGPLPVGKGDPATGVRAPFSAMRKAQTLPIPFVA
jgi:hypothetical protein